MQTLTLEKLPDTAVAQLAKCNPHTLRVDLLVELRDFLEKTVLLGRFNMEWWTSSNDHNCKTTHCAMGWASTLPGFQKEGFALNSEGHPVLVPLVYTDEGQELSNWYAVNAVFGFDPFKVFSSGEPDLCSWLFLTYNYPSNYRSYHKWPVIARINAAINHINNLRENYHADPKPS